MPNEDEAKFPIVQLGNKYFTKLTALSAHDEVLSRRSQGNPRPVASKGIGYLVEANITKACYENAYLTRVDRAP